jgi:RNA polymerase sigma factor, sigma-70 family
MAESRDRIVAWVGVQIMPHEPVVRRWLRRSMVSREDIDDLIQEAYCRLAGLSDVSHIEKPHAYFMLIVQNLLTDQIRRSRIVRFETVAEMDSLALLADEPSPERITAGRRDLARVRRLIAALPDRCRRIFELRKIHGVSQKDIARTLGVSEATVENEGVKGLRLIMAALREEDGGLRHETLDGKASGRTRIRATD